MGEPDERHRPALIVAAQARDNLTAAQKGYEAQVTSANEGFAKQMDDTFASSGYSKHTGRYLRRSIKGSTAFETLYEDQSVEGYRYYISPGFEVKTKLDDTSLQGLEADTIQTLVSQALGELKTKSEEIFGKSVGQRRPEHQGPDRRVQLQHSDSRNRGTRPADRLVPVLRDATAVKWSAKRLATV